MTHDLQKIAVYAVALFVCALSPAWGQESGALLDLLVRKGVLSDQEAAEVRADLARDSSAASAAKWSLSSGLTELKLGGDARVRFEARGGEDSSGDHFERERFRYRFRLGLSGRYQGAWFFGTRLETGSGARSTNVTFGGDAGPSGKADDGIRIGQLYLGWQPNQAWTLLAGRMPNPLVTSSMVWDGDINPEGLAQQVRFSRGDSEFFATAGQFVYDDAGPENAFGSAPGKEDLFMLTAQAGWKFKPSATSALQIAPAVYTYSEGGDSFSGPFAADRLTAVNDLLVVEVPVEFSWVAGETPLRLFGDFAINLEAEDRARAWGRPDLAGEDTAFQVGFQWGRARGAGGWDARVFYQSSGAFALDPNLVDSDLFDSRLNLEGIGFVGNFALTNSITTTVTYAHAERKEASFPVVGSGDVGTADLAKYHLLQADLNFKF